MGHRTDPDDRAGLPAGSGAEPAAGAAAGSGATSELAAWFATEGAEPAASSAQDGDDIPSVDGTNGGAQGSLPSRRSRRETAAEGERPHPGIAVAKVVASLVIVAAGLAAIIGLVQQRGAGTGPGGDPAATAEVGPDGEPRPVITRPDDADELVAQARDSREALIALPASSDCSNLYADSQLFHRYSVLVPAGDTWPDLVSARLPSAVLGDIADACDDGYAEQLARYIVEDGRSEEVLVYSVQEHLGQLPQEHPAPEDAEELEGFTALDGALHCTMTGDGVGCSISGRTFPDPEVCPTPGGDSFSVALFSADIFPCAGTLGDFPDELADGQSATFADYACTVAGDAVSCWHTVSGTGFELSKDEFSEF